MAYSWFSTYLRSFLWALLESNWGVVVDALDQVEVPVNRGVVGQHVHDKAFLDGLLHRVVVEGPVLDRAVRLRVWCPEEFEGLVLRGGGEREVGGVGQQPPALDYPVDLVLEGVLVLIILCGFSQGPGHGTGSLPALAGVRLVDDDGESAVSVVVADVFQDEGELLDGGDDNLLAFLDEPAEVSGPIGVSHGGGDLGELPDGPVNLPVQHSPVRDDYDGVEGVVSFVFHANELPGHPSYGVGLAAAGRVLDQVSLASAVDPDVFEELPHDVQLVVPGPYLAVVGLLGVILEDVREPVGGEDLFPQVCYLHAVGVHWVAGPAVVSALVEGQEVGGLALEFGAELHLFVIHCEVDGAAA